MPRPATYSCLESSVSFVNRVLISMPVWGGHSCPTPLTWTSPPPLSSCQISSVRTRKNGAPANRGHSPRSTHHASRYFSNFDRFRRLAGNSFNALSLRTNLIGSTYHALSGATYATNASKSFAL